MTSKVVYGTCLVLLLVLAFLAGHWYTFRDPAKVDSPRAADPLLRRPHEPGPHLR